MSAVVEVGEYAFEMLKLEAERRGMTVEDLCLSFFVDGCNAPNFCPEVQCTSEEPQKESK